MPIVKESARQAPVPLKEAVTAAVAVATARSMIEHPPELKLGIG